MATSKVLEIIVKATDQASKQFDAISENSKKLSESLKDVKKYSGIATTALVGLGGIMVKQATDIEPVRNAFDNLTQTVGESSDAMLKSLKEASKGAVSEYDLMLSANRSMKLGVAQNTEDMTDLMKIARLYGQQMGQDVTQSFNDIVTGLGRGSPMILDNLGIIIDSEKAYEDYAQQLGKTASELTKSEKTQALVNATLVEGRKALDEFGEPLPTMAEKFQKLKNSITETGTKIGSALLPVIQKILDAVQPIIDKLADWIDKNPELASKILLVTTAVSGLIFVMSSLPGIVSSISSGLSFLMSPIGLIMAGITALAIARATDFGGIREKTAEIVDRISEIITPRLERLQAFWSEHGETIKMVVGVLRDAVGKIFGAGVELIGGILEVFLNQIDIWLNLFSGNREGAWEGIKNQFQTIWETMGRIGESLFGEWLDRVADKLVQFGNWFTEKWNRLSNTVTGIATALREGLKTGFEFWIAIFTGDREKASGIATSVVQGLDIALTSIFGDMWENIKGAFQKGIDRVIDKLNTFKDTVMSIINGIKNAWNDAKSIVGNIGNKAKDIAGDVREGAKNIVGFANGGAVAGGKPILVGERGPELFVPQSAGNIIPNENIVNNNGVTINMSGVSIRKDSDIQDLAQEIIRQTKLEKNYGII